MPIINDAMRSAPINLEPYTASAFPSINGSNKIGYSFGLYSKSVSLIITMSPETLLIPVRKAAPLPLFFS